MKLEFYEMTTAIAAGRYGQAVDILLAHFGEKDNHLSFEITTTARSPTLPIYSVRLYYFGGSELAWNPLSGFFRVDVYERRFSRHGLLGRATVIA